MFFKNIFDDLDYLLKCTNKVFDIILVTQTRITKQTSLATKINLRNYDTEFTSTRLLCKHFCVQPFPPKDSVFLLFA